MKDRTKTCIVLLALGLIVNTLHIMHVASRVQDLANPEQLEIPIPGYKTGDKLPSKIFKPHDKETNP
jgi:hypothetical protein